MIIENAVIMNKKFRFFSRSGEKEIDFIEDKGSIPIEVKYRNDVKEKELKYLIKFLEKNKINNAFVITKDLDKEEKFGSKKIKFVPLWKWLLS